MLGSWRLHGAILAFERHYFRLECDKFGLFGGRCLLSFLTLHVLVPVERLRHQVVGRDLSSVVVFPFKAGQ